jgi:hypothetical protein
VIGAGPPNLAIIPRSSPDGYPADAPRGLGHEPQEVPPSLPRGTAAGAPARRTQESKRATRTRVPLTIPQGANQRWSLDFMSDVRRRRALPQFGSSSTTSLANAWRPPPIRRYPVCGLCASSRLSLLNVVRRPCA